jgi:uncharacterized protein (TIGR00730 family)
MAEIRSVCVYCGSSAGAEPVHRETARKLGAILTREKIRLIYGGGGIGLMGALAHAVMQAGGEVTGVIPEFLVAREHAFAGAREVVVTRDMHERKRIMFERSDAFITLPGGIGTLEELVEQLSWIQLERHKKPVAIVNVNGFWNPLLELLGHLREQRFLQARRPLYLTVDRVEDAVPRLRQAVRGVAEAELHGPAAQAAVQEM